MDVCPACRCQGTALWKSFVWSSADSTWKEKMLGSTAVAKQLLREIADSLIAKNIPPEHLFAPLCSTSVLLVLLGTRTTRKLLFAM